MSRKDIGRRLEALEEPDAPARAEYVEAKNRALAHALSSFGAKLEPHEEHDLGSGYGEDDFAADSDILARYRASLDPEGRKREQHGLMRLLYRELEQRGVDPYMEDDDVDLE